MKRNKISRFARNDSRLLSEGGYCGGCAAAISLPHTHAPVIPNEVRNLRSFTAFRMTIISPFGGGLRGRIFPHACVIPNRVRNPKKK